MDIPGAINCMQSEFIEKSLPKLAWPKKDNIGRLTYRVFVSMSRKLLYHIDVRRTKIFKIDERMEI